MTRRSSSALSARGRGVRPIRRCSAPRKASIGFTPAVASGTLGRTGGRNDQWSRGSRAASSPAGAFAPDSIQDRIAAISSGLSGSPSGGMRVDGSAAVTRSTSRLSSTPFGSTAGPFSPPLRMAPAVSSRNPAFCFKAPWHETQRRARTGLTSLRINVRTIRHDGQRGQECQRGQDHQTPRGQWGGHGAGEACSSNRSIKRRSLPAMHSDSTVRRQRSIPEPRILAISMISRAILTSPVDFVNFAG